MSTRKSKRCKNSTYSVGSKTKSSEPEIFVLPPNLLQKLGIDLENVEPTQQCSTIVLPTSHSFDYEANSSIIKNNKDPTVIDTHSDLEGKTFGSEKETTILETANLMKKSLLLSPSLISSTTNALDEVTNVEMNHTGSISMLSIDPQFKNHGAFQYIDSCDTLSALNGQQVDENLLVNTPNYVDCDDVVREICNNLKLDSNVVTTFEKMSELEAIKDNGGNVLTEVTENTDVMSIDDHPDEAYLSDFSNSNPGPIENTCIIMFSPENHSYNQQKGETDTNTQCSSKINILSEELISLSQFKELKNMHNSKVSQLIPVTVNTIIPGRKMHDLSHSNVELDNNLSQYNTNILVGASYSPGNITVSDLVGIYDDRENGMPSPHTTYSSIIAGDMPETLVSEQADLEEKESKAIIENTHNNIANMPEIPNKEISNNNMKSEGQSPDNGFGVGLDIAETDIEECLQESVEFLEQIVNEITSHDSDDLYNIKDVERKPINKIICNNSHPVAASISQFERDSDFYVFQNDVKPINSNTEINNRNYHSINSSAFNNNSNEIENVNKDTEAKLKLPNFRIHKTGEHIMSKTHFEKNKISKESSEKINSNSAPTVMCDTDENGTHVRQDNKLEIRENLEQVLLANNKINNGIDVNEKAKEIAMYLKQYNLVHLNISNINSGTNCNKQTKDRNKLKSKRSIHGVEKPGGIKSNKTGRGGSVVFKTYGRNIKPRQSFTSALVAGSDCKKQSLCSSSDTLEKELNCGNVSSNSAKEYFCLCGDFGRLDNYDCDSMYEHIHFWEHKKISCNNEDIISIYNEYDGNFIKENIRDEGTVQEAEADTSEINEHSICWNDIEHIDFSRDILTLSRDNFTEIARVNVRESSTNTIEVGQDTITAFSHSKEAYKNQQHMILFEQNIVNARSSIKSPTELDTNDGIIKPGSVCDNTLERFEVISVIEPSNQYEPEELVGYEIKSTGQKRRKSFTRQQLTDEPQSKKSVKCGVCEELVTELQWDDHADNAHGAIAWKFGDIFDFENLNLLKKIQERLKKEIRLKCLFCDAGFKKPRRYLQHVKKCLKVKEGNDPSHSVDTSMEDIPMSTPLVGLNSVKCGVCGQEMNGDNWVNHIAKEHNYLAWKHGEPLLDLANVEIVRKHLTDLAKHIGGLICSKCGLMRKYGKSYLHHLEVCHACEVTCDDSKHNERFCGSCVSDSNFSIGISDVRSNKSGDKSIVKRNLLNDKSKDDDSYNETFTGSDIYTLESNANTSKAGYKSIVKSISDNNSNMKKRKLRNKSRVNKNKDDDSNAEPISVSYDVTLESNTNTSKAGNKSFVKSQTQNKSNVKSKLRNKSRLKSKDDYSKVFDTLSGSNYVSLESNTSEASNKSIVKREADKIVKCGACQKEVRSHDWMIHIQREHDYLAWKQGETLNLNNEEDVKNHLSLIIKETGGLTCPKCGFHRKSVKGYLGHIRKCKVEPVIYDQKIHSIDREDTRVCGVCLERGISVNDWKDHAMKKHYNIAWTVGEMPIDVKNPYIAERLLKEYRDRYKKLICRICGTGRASCMGFYAHVLICGKSDEESEVYKNLCPICNKKYICIYENQHMTAHREQENAKERKLREAEQKVKVKTEIEIEILPGRRRAAEKAISVIEKYKSEHELRYNCESCGFGTDSIAELEAHKCEKTSGYLSNSDDSVKDEQSSDEEPESDIDSAISEVEENETVKRRHKDHVTLWAKTPRLPYAVKAPNDYLLSSGKTYCMFHFTDERLFPDWHSFECKPVPDDELLKYMPPLDQSCKVKFGSDTWTTYSRFEAKKQNGFSIFVGASIQCMSWVPARAGADANDRSYLAVVCHGSVDAPRFEVHETPQHEGLLQIWDFGGFREIPTFVCGFAHDFGTVWAMAWCPSGARDPPDTEEVNNHSRMGLVALACSNGSAYIFCVPYPSAIVKVEKMFHKLKPVAELRLSMGPYRKTYQATAVSWSPQRGHTLVVVGYGDGTTAYYDLNTNSPLLKNEANDITVLYPYHDERPHNTCVTDVDVCASTEAHAGAGAVCSAAPSGAQAALRPAARPVQVRAHCAARRAMFEPHWPAAMLGGEDHVGVAPNELEWWGCGRRFGDVRACAACVRCARVALSTPPLLRVLRPHPAYSEVYKRTIGTLQMSPIGWKRKKLAKDELATILEPTTYDDAVKKYGIELILQNVPMPLGKELYPERFPLADVTALSFCSSAAHHSRLAVATHAGVVFVLTV